MKPMHRWFVVSSCLLSILVGLSRPLVFPAPAIAAPPSVDGPLAVTLTVLPTLPQVDQPIHVTIAGTWYDSCVPHYAGHQIRNGLVTVTLTIPEPELVCGQVATPWSITVALGQLPAAHYQVHVDGAVTLSTTMTVFSDFIYLPLIRGES